MLNTVFSNDGRFIFFDVLTPLKIGVTTSEFGNGNTKNNPENETKMKEILETAKAKLFFKILPQHSDKMHIIKQNGNLGNIKKADALIFEPTRFSPGETPVLISPTSDCPIIILANRGTFAIIHCGWKNLLTTIIKNTIELLGPANTTKAFVWPGISSKYYEVGTEFEDYFPGYIISDRFDLSGYIRKMLGGLKISGKNIFIPNFCSFSSVNEKGKFLFFSRRRGDQSGNLVFVSA